MTPQDSSLIRITRNAAECVHCHTVVESTHDSHTVGCACGAIAVAGGHTRLVRRGVLDDFIEHTEYSGRI